MGGRRKQTLVEYKKKVLLNMLIAFPVLCARNVQKPYGALEKQINLSLCEDTWPKLTIYTKKCIMSLFKSVPKRLEFRVEGLLMGAITSQTLAPATIPTEYMFTKMEHFLPLLLARK